MKTKNNSIKSAKTLMKKWWNRKIPQPWLTICWLIALTILMLYGYALSLAL